MADDGNAFPGDIHPLGSLPNLTVVLFYMVKMAFRLNNALKPLVVGLFPCSADHLVFWERLQRLSSDVNDARHWLLSYGRTLYKSVFKTTSLNHVSYFIRMSIVTYTHYKACLFIFTLFFLL